MERFSFKIHPRPIDRQEGGKNLERDLYQRGYLRGVGGGEVQLDFGWAASHQVNQSYRPVQFSVRYWPASHSRSNERDRDIISSTQLLILMSSTYMCWWILISRFQMSIRIISAGMLSNNVNDSYLILKTLRRVRREVTWESSRDKNPGARRATIPPGAIPDHGSKFPDDPCFLALHFPSYWKDPRHSDQYSMKT